MANFGYDPSKIKDTPQDCEVMTASQLAAMMSMSGMKEALTNQFPDLSKELGEVFVVFVPERRKWKDTKGEGDTPFFFESPKLYDEPSSSRRTTSRP